MRYSLYLHIPFCSHRCAYCDFNTYAGQASSIPAYVDALTRELESLGKAAPADLEVGTVFFGGGTPTLLSASQFKLIVGAIRANFQVNEGVEMTTEANPGTVSERDLAAIRELGINRISFGAQSANAEELRMLERQHSFLDVRMAVSAARRSGFNSINVDLIYGLPEQSLETWQITVGRVLELQPDHISAYALTLEHGTPFGHWSARGLIPMPDADLAADMYEWISAELGTEYYVHYEISNWAREGHACRHNLQYWRGLPYLGLGAGAHGYANGYRYSNVLRIRTYIGRLGRNAEAATRGFDANGLASLESGTPPPSFPFSAAMVNQHKQTSEDEIEEFMINGLRLTREGIAAADYRARFGCDVRDQFPEELRELGRLGLIECVPARSLGSNSAAALCQDESELIRLTSRGRLLGNQVFLRFLHPKPITSPKPSLVGV